MVWYSIKMQHTLDSTQLRKCTVQRWKTLEKNKVSLKLHFSSHLIFIANYTTSLHTYIHESNNNNKALWFYLSPFHSFHTRFLSICLEGTYWSHRIVYRYFHAHTFTIFIQYGNDRIEGWRNISYIKLHYAVYLLTAALLFSGTSLFCCLPYNNCNNSIVYSDKRILCGWYNIKWGRMGKGGRCIEK